MTAPKVLVTIPTYSESENIEALIRGIFALPVPGIEIAIFDDQSPDGTADVVQKLVSGFPKLFLIQREKPAGRGLAGRDGFLYALQSEADFTIEMDGDFSHQPKYIPELLKAMDSCDVAVGSRLVAGGTDADRPLWRRCLTHLANFYSRVLLRFPIADTNSGFRCFSRYALEKIDPESLQSVGPSIVHEVLYRAVRAGLKIQEVPIEFIDRKKGESKLNLSRLAAGYFWILKLRFRRGG